MKNRLAQETSPYLLQHANNPVDWYPWGEEAFNRARAEDKPVLLSIGYSACHWCHVMAHESFENEEIARLMNENFINIKVDREEHPDVDSIYMQAVQTLTGTGGWPLTIFLTPEGKPFFGGTYFPPQDKYGLPAFSKVLKAVAHAYRNSRVAVEETAAQLTAIISRTALSTVVEPLSADILREAYLALRQEFDSVNGGFGTAPKFPQPMALEFLLKYFRRYRDVTALGMVELTLEKMARGGIHDQLGGGFHRYATDSLWRVPHFEKMLYDNALLSQLYTHAYLVTGKQLYSTTAQQTLDYVLREMTDPTGGFYSSQDADSEGVEGKYYLWTQQEIAEVVGEEHSRIINDYFGVTAQGNFNGLNILHIASDYIPESPAIIEQARKALMNRRGHRVKPGRDEKILASWNGLMLASLAEAAGIFDRQDYLNAAVANGFFLLERMLNDGHLKRTYKDGVARINGFLEDYALVITGLLGLHQATFGGIWLRQAIKLAEVMVGQFWEETSKTFYDAGDRHDQLVVRPRNIFDTSVPSGSSAATSVLFRLARLTGNEHFYQIALESLRSKAGFLRRNPIGFANWLCALDFHLSTPEEIVIIGPRKSPATSALLRVLNARWLPNKVMVAYDPDDTMPVTGLGLLGDKKMVNDRPTVYLCKGYSCRAPVTDPDSLARLLQEI